MIPTGLLFGRTGNLKLLQLPTQGERGSKTMASVDDLRKLYIAPLSFVHDGDIAYSLVLPAERTIHLGHTQQQCNNQHATTQQPNKRSKLKNNTKERICRVHWTIDSIERIDIGINGIRNLCRPWNGNGTTGQPTLVVRTKLTNKNICPNNNNNNKEFSNNIGSYIRIHPSIHHRSMWY